MMKVGRRGFLLGIGGAMVSLPLLESLGANRAKAGPDARRRYAVFVRTGNGVQQGWDSEPERFFPSETGPLTPELLSGRDAGRALSELAPFASRLNVLRGVNRPFGTPSCGHSESIVQCLTAANHTGGPSNEPLALGMSADWRIAQQLNPAGREPLNLMAGPQGAYIGANLSWRAPSTIAPAQHSPADVFMNLMGLPALPPEVQQRLVDRRNSINDLVREEMTALMSSPQLSARDHRRLQQHFDAIRDFELSGMCELDPALVDTVTGITEPQGNDVRPEVVRAHMELIAFAFNCGYTRAATLQVGEGNDQTQWEIGGSRLPRAHWISHRIYSDGAEGEPIPNAVDLHHQIDRLHMQHFRHLLEALDRYESPYGGRLLDDTVACWFNDLAQGPPHGGQNVPWILAGSASGCLRTGEYRDLGGVTYDRVLNTVLSAVGCTKDDGSPVDDFGDDSLAGGTLDFLV